MTRLIAIVGPTASGKSVVGVELARKINGEIISCDSMQVYKGMPVCTQAPPKIVRGIRHHLVSFVDPSREYSAAQFRKDAERAVHSILKQKKAPILVGGTGLYLRALLDGLFESSAKDEAFRERLNAEAAEKTPVFLHERLTKADPATAAKIHPNDLRRIIRALEVYHQTGKPMSELKPKRQGLRSSLDCRVFLLDRDRAELYARIDKRVDAMLRGGLLREAKRLSKKRLSQTAAMALGLKEAKQYLMGEIPLKDAVDLLKKNSRNYAKRQLSWFRHERDVVVIPVKEKEMTTSIIDKIMTVLYNSSHTPLFSAKHRGGSAVFCGGIKEGGSQKPERRSPSFLKRGTVGGS